MKQTSIAEPVIVPENGGAVLNAFGDQVTVKLNAAHTGGAFALCIDQVPPGGGPPLHYHLKEDELFIVQAGRIEYFVENRSIELGPGGVVFAPRNVSHRFRNPSDEPARHWVMCNPSGFETFFERCAVEFAKPNGPDMNRITAIGAEHGIHFLEAAAHSRTAEGTDRRGKHGKQPSKAKPVIVPENGGNVLNAFGVQITVKMDSAHSGGAFTLSQDQVPPGGGPPLHYHLNEDELFIVQEGRIEYFVGDRRVELGPGGVVLAPRDLPHRFHNPGAKPARHWELFFPSGFETFFQRCVAEFGKAGGPDMNRITAISAEHGIHYV
jgi:mannose-6-phosphate isomerase-like protein (cupin superfamily)